MEKVPFLLPRRPTVSLDLRTLTFVAESGYELKNMNLNYLVRVLDYALFNAFDLFELF